MLKQKQNKRFFFFFFFFNIYFYVGPYIDGFFFIPHFYLFIYYYFLTQVDKLGGTEPLSSETERCLYMYYIKLQLYIIECVPELEVHIHIMQDPVCGLRQVSEKTMIIEFGVKLNQGSACIHYGPLHVVRDHCRCNHGSD